ncbi:hypothetical protein EOL70_10280 [Leucothrix sargassi]|nr:hypothetical protein EOL70_10280 [Leucothrix sargassi]
MSDAQTAYASAHFEHSLELNNSALALSKENFPSLFKKNAEQAVATVLVSYFSSIDNCETLADYPKAQQLFNSALHFLHTEKLKADLSTQQKTALFRGALQINKEWCEFINAHNDQIPSASREAFQLSINRLSSFRECGINLH